MKARLLAFVAAAGCHVSPPPAAQKPPPMVVTEVAAEPVAPFRSLPPPMLPVDCGEAARAGVVEFCDQQLATSATHVACHRIDQVSTAALACFPELRSLTLRDTKVARLEPLRGLKHLRRLNLSRTNVADLGPLAEVPSLRELALDETRVSDLAPLATLPELAKLRIRKARSVDWNTLSGLPSLVELDVSNNEQAHLAALAGHRSLRTAHVPDTIADFEPLASMPQLRKLVVEREWSRSVPIPRRRKVFEGLAAVTQLRELELHRTEVTSLAPLAGMSKLEHLWIGAPKVTSLAPLTKLRNLAFVGLSDTWGLGDPQAELASLGSLPKLVSLTVFSSPPNTSYLEAFSNLEGLLLSALGTEALDLEGVAALPKLEVFELRFSKVERLSPLIRVRSLTRVDIGPSVDVSASEVAALRRARPGLAISYSPKPKDADGLDDW